VPLDPRDRFTGLAATYQRHRPSYPPALFDWIESLFAPRRPSTAADVGCGTGIATRLLAARGLDVVGVDPNEDMLAAARAEGGARYVRGDAEATGLAGASVDLVACAQAFHWFDAGRAFAEFRRVVRPDGWCAAWWNGRASSPLNDEYERLLTTYSEEYPTLFGGDDMATFRAGVRGDVRTATFANSQRLDRDGYLGRVESSSYVRHGTSRKDEFLREVAALFGRHERDGTVEILYACRAFAWRG
jgi:SAM-dependent methyltransferase